MANQYSWKNANIAGYITTIQQLSRKTIADGDLLNNNILAFSSRDTYINDSMTDLSDKAQFVYDTVMSNYDKFWSNSALSGFSAIEVNDAKLEMTSVNDGPITFGFVGFDTKIDGNTVTLNLPEYYTSSYMLCASALRNTEGNDTLLSFAENAFNTDVILGANNTIHANEKGIKIQGSEASYAGIAVNGSTARNGIAINNSINARYDKPGIMINSSTGDNSLLAIAVNNTNAINSNNTYSFGFNDSQVYANCLAINSTNTMNYSIGLNCTKYAIQNQSFAYSTTHTVANCSVSLFNESAVTNGSIGLFDSNAHHNTVALYDSCTYSTDSDFSNIGFNILLYNSSAANYDNTNSTAGAAIALYDSLAARQGLSVYNSTADCHAVAMYNSSATRAGLSFYNSVEQEYGAALYNSSAFRDAFAFDNCSAQENSFVFDNCYNIDSSNVLLTHESSAISARACLISHASNAYNVDASIIAHNSIASGYSVRNISSHDVEAHIVTHGSKIGTLVSEFPKYVYSASTCGGDLLSATSGVYKRIAGITRYNSLNDGSCCISEYSSTIYPGVELSIAMYNSTISTDTMYLCTGESTTGNTVLSSVCNNNIAMYGSTINNEVNTIQLWNNQVKIEPHGFINNNKYIDLNIAQNNKQLKLADVYAYIAVNKKIFVIG